MPTAGPPVFGAAAGKGPTPSRGYFSDVNANDSTSTLGPSADRTMDGRSNQPFAYAFKSAGGGSAALARKLHAHSGHSEALPEGKLSASTAASSSFNPNADVPDKALQPKVFVPHARQTGSAAVPRKVAMERKRREFAEQTSSTSSSIEDLLRVRLVDYATVSGGDMTPAESDSTAAHCASLPLEAFDSSDYEIRSEKNWISLGVDEVTGQQRGVPAIGLYLNAEGFGEWRACRAVAWETRPGPPGGAATVGKFAVVWMNDSSNATIGGSKMRSSLEGHIAAGRSNAADDTEGKGGEFKESDAKIDAELASLVPGGNGVVSRLLRLHICFASEDPVNFADRLANAFKKRREAAQLIRYLLYVDCMPIEDGPQLLQKQLNAITNQTLAARSLAHIHVAYTNPSQHPPQLRERASTQYSVLQNLLGEVQTDFVRSMNKVIFDGTVEAMRVAKATGQDPAAAAAAAFGASAGGVPTDLALLATVDVPPPTPKAPVPYKALLTIPSHPFAANKEAFSFITLCSKSEVIQVFQRAATENAKIFHKGGATAGFLVGSPGKPLKLDEYETAQATATHQFATFLREGWAQTTRNMVRASLANVGKGNFNLKETNAKAYEYSKLRKLLRNIGFRMADELRYSADAQLHDFTAACEAACEFECVVTSPQAITVTLPGGSGIFKRPPLYALDVIIKDEPITAAPGAPSGAPAPAAPAAGAAHAAAPAAAHAKEEKKDPKAKTKEKKENVPMRKVFGYPGANIEALALAPVTAFEKAVRALSGVTTVERMVMDRLFWPEEPTVPCVNFLEPHVQVMKEKMTAKLSKASRPLEAFIRTLDPYVAFLNVDVDEQVNALKTKMAAAGAFNAADCKSAIIKARDSATAVLDALPISVNLGFAVVSVADVRQFIYKKHLSMAEAILKMVAQQAADTSADIGKQYDYMIKSLSAPTTDIESLTQLKEFMTACPEKIKEQQARYVTNLQCYQLLEDYVVPLPKDQFDLQWKALGGAQRVQKKIADVEAELEKEKTKYMEDMAAEQTEFEGTLGDLSDEVNGLSKYGKMDEIEPAAAHCQSLQGRLKVSEEKANLFNLREGLFGKDITNYDKIGDIKKAFEPYFTLWDSANSWLKQHHEWMLGAFINLNPETIERDAGAASRNMARSVKAFEKIGNEGCIQVAKTLRDQCEAFKPLVPLVVALRNPGMRTRHWQELSDQIGEKIDPDKDKEAFTLTIVLEKNLARHIDFINKVGEKAGKEYQLEQALDKMAGEWQTMFMDVFAYRESGTFVVKGVDEQQALLDEHTTMTQAMAFSAFKKPFAERIDQWASTLLTCSEVLDEWLKVQRSWMYLEPIFSSSDIQKQLPTEYKRFATVDKNWRATLLAARGGAGKDAQPQKCIQFCNNAKLLEKWQESNRFLDLVQKGLSDYLETKRAGFARFYFLSNDELLEILSQTKDPRAVQPHLKKCFEGVRSVTFLPTTEIKVMISGEKEKIDLSYLVDPRGKNVEVWMSDFEECMKRSVRACMFTGLSDYTTTPRTQWVQKHPGQIVLNASQMHWTREIEAGIRDMGAEGVKKVYEAQLTQLKDIVVLIRGKLATLARITLGSLTVIDVHARDVTKKLATVGVSTLNDFEWISQLRYKWEGDADTGDFWAMMVSSTRPYGYEYLGNSLRLVITPLTDKCYMTIMSALQMGLGGAPAGPAGTGKTETTKDLAKALAMYCVVFNCSDGLDYIAMGKFFKGLAAAGAWACFDEFNRIDVEVLSVVAQQVLTLTEGVRAGLQRIFFEGTEIPLNPRFASFITMNPGYAGRSELPDNLKVLFRPVAMMVPDYALIGEIMFYSYGFDAARAMGDKMVATFKLCSEQLSAQDHYDYGMRAVKTVITAAGNLKSANPEEDEEMLLYRALSDVNLPKFLAPDLPLFKGIMSDLFPTIGKPNVDHGELNKVLVLCTEKRGLQPVPYFITKCVQLYEMVVVRHGMMMVGPTGGGKSEMLKTTQMALTLLNSKGRTGPKVEKVEIYSLNPKSITMGQLYGQFDDATHEWTDGILADMVRECAKSTTPALKWVVFDGPVDAIWIENMNTVLDDNKKLCLVSGEIIGLSNEMTIMFEVEDLAVASPATVSRCGMVYTEPTSLGFDVLVQSWIEALPPCFSNPMKAQLQALFDTYVKSTLYFLRRYLEEPVPTADNQLVRGLTNLMDCFLEPYSLKEGRDPPSADAVKKLGTQLPALFMFSLTWSVAATSNRDGRKRFNAFLRGEMESAGFPFPFPEPKGEQVYDFAWDMTSGEWKPWMMTVPTYEVPKGADFAEIIVQTKDTVRYKYLAKTLLMNRKKILMSGPTGTGKTVNISELLGSDMPKEYIPITLTFSAQTSANQTQDIIDGKMEKRQRGTFGPAAGSVFVIFVDDLNMPMKETYGAQPPIEILRQWCDFSGWYDRKERVFRKIIDTVIMAAMGPPGGGRNSITARFVRHFNVINYTPMDDDSMRTIFETILANFCLPTPDTVKQLVPAVVLSTISVYNSSIDSLLPTPSKPHYTFNLRDLGKVFQGLLMADVRKVSTPNDLARMWIHECRRVFGDRLINAQDRTWFNEALADRVASKDFMKLNYEEVTSGRSTILYGDYMIPGAEPKVYAEVDDMTKLQPVIEEYLSDYNAESKSPMKLVMFLDAIEHVSRISRIIRQPGGNALLLGVGGSGRQSLTRLATFMAGFTLYSIEISKGYGKNEWREDLKKVLLKAGVEEKPTVFLFNDTQIIFEGQVEDLNGVLNSGDVPNLYAVEDIDAITNACRGDCLKKRLPPTKINVFAQYLIRVKRNLHMAVAMSPMGEAFRNRLRMFPALVNCTTIDWFAEWPDDALKNVAMRSLTEKDLKLGESTDGVVEFFKAAHQGVAEASKQYAASMRRYNYVTPTSYLELLSTFRNVLQKQREVCGTMRDRLQNGLDKIISTEGIVSKLQEDIVAMQPILAETQIKVAEMIVNIDKDKASAAETKIVVEQEEASANKLAAETKAIADDAQADLDKALPALEKAVECLDKLKKGDIDEVKAMKTPPGAVKVTMQACLIMFNIKPKLVNDPDNMGKKLKDYWGTAQAGILQDAKGLLQSLKDYDKDNIPEATINEIKSLIEDPSFTFEVVDKASKACSGICLWVHAMYTYYFVAKNVEPKKAKLKEAQDSLAVTMQKLAGVQASLKAVMDKVASLERDLKGANDKKEELARDVATASARLERAHKLLGGLGGEKSRWIVTVAKLNQDYSALVGDSLVAATTIAYLGAFTADFRASLVKTMQGEIARLNLPHNPGCTMLTVLQDPVQVRSWNLAGLPTDQSSVENGMIMKWARRWPLFIDPQGQANRFLKNLGKDKTYAPNGLDVIRMTDKKFLQGLENGIRFGRWILIENVLETLDAALEPVLLQQVFKQGGSDMMKLGDSTVPYNNDFKLFMTSTLPNPHYQPEAQVKVSLLNFTITQKGLEDQMLGVFVVTELPELEEKKNALMLSNAKNKKDLQDIESRILFLLSNSKGNILDDGELIETLSVSKVKAGEIQAAVAEAEVTEKEIDVTRENYRPVAYRASILYFCIADLSGVDPMYQYSLPWFTQLFINGIRNSAPAEDFIVRMDNLNKFFTYSVYKNVCRSLFEVHKPLFSLLLTIKIMQGDNKVDASEWRFVISGQTPTVPPTARPNPDKEWVTDKIWNEVTALSTLDAFKGYDESWSDPEMMKGYKAIFESNESHRVALPGKFNELNGLQRMCMLRTIRPDKILLAAQDFVIANMEQKFVMPPPFDLAACYEDAVVTTPLIFVLSSGSDPTKAFLTFAETIGMRSKVEVISLGQGQGPIAQRLVDEAQTKGGWVLLQNCHLAASWMGDLERIVEAIDPEKVHRDFRLWLTSMPSKAFPVSVLQNGVKMTNEPPKGLKANIRNFMYQLNDDQVSVTTKPAVYRKLLFGLAFFHAVVQERKRFGPLGWNRPYDFNDSDMEITLRQVMLYLDEYEQVPFRVLHVLATYINYGGRVTDDKDARTIDVIMRDYFTPRIVDEDYKFTKSGIYYAPTVDDDAPHKGFLEYVDSLPLNAMPEVFGFHDNANITCELNETEEGLDVLLSLQPRTGGGGGRSRDDIVADRAKDIQGRLAPNFDIESIGMAYPVVYHESMNTVLLQECIRYNKLLSAIKRDLANLLKALKGLIVMSADLDAVGNALHTNKVPPAWESKAYPSLKPLAAWTQDLIDRLKFLNDWVAVGPPPVTWISGFFFPQAFLTGITQNYARKKGLPIDTLKNDYIYMWNRTVESFPKRPEDGCYIRGLFLEGARMDEDACCIADSRPKILFTNVPVIWLNPVQFRKPTQKDIYMCPVYKILSRWGVLATTGHSSNFVMWIEVPCKECDMGVGGLLGGGPAPNTFGDTDASKWCKAGVAAFLSLKF